jgi:predicted flap endonuclease-1-like 5' DNA nuclease
MAIVTPTPASSGSITMLHGGSVGGRSGGTGAPAHDNVGRTIMPPPRSQPSHATPPAAAAEPALPLSKLRAVPFQVRVALKIRRITICGQLLAAAAAVQDREALARSARIAPETLTGLVRQADLARVNGVGTVFGRMLEELGIDDVAGLAAQDPEALHARLRAYNRQERLARRSPTPEEVADWVGQATAMRKLVSY